MSRGSGVLKNHGERCLQCGVPIGPGGREITVRAPALADWRACTKTASRRGSAGGSSNDGGKSGRSSAAR